MRTTRPESANRIRPAAATSLALCEDAGGFTLHALDLTGVTPLGTFASAAEAWRAVDAIDARTVSGS